MTKNRAAAIGLLITALGIAMWLVGAVIASPSISATVSGIGLTVAGIGVLVVLVAVAVRMLRAKS